MYATYKFGNNMIWVGVVEYWRLMKMLRALNVLFLCAIAAPSYAEDSLRYKELIGEGIKLYRSKDFEASLKKFQAAVDDAKPNSLDQLAALENLSLPLAELKREPELWNNRRKAALLKKELQGTPIPEELDGETPDQAKENVLLKKLAQSSIDKKKPAIAESTRRDLLNYYQSKHEFEKADGVFSELASATVKPQSLAALHKEWANWCRAEGNTDLASKHDSTALSIQNSIAKAESDRKEKERIAASVQSKQQQEQRNERIKNHELWYRIVTQTPVETPEVTNPEGQQSRIVQFAIDRAEATNNKIKAMAELKFQIDRSSGAHLAQAKAEYVDALDSLEESSDYLTGSAKQALSWDHYWAAEYIAQVAYKASYVLFKKGDERFEQLYKIFCESKKAREAIVNDKDSKYR